MRCVLQPISRFVILDKIKELFPECRRVSVYGSAKDVLRKTPEELSELREHGMGMIYLGAESGSDKVFAGHLQRSNPRADD